MAINMNIESPQPINFTAVNAGTPQLVKSVNGQTGVVVLDAEDVGANGNNGANGSAGGIIIYY